MSITTCNCTDRNGKSKQLYKSVKQAENQAIFIKQDRNIVLEVYKCPEKPGCHLTKSTKNNSLVHTQQVLLPRSHIKISIGDTMSEELISQLKRNPIR